MNKTFLIIFSLISNILFAQNKEIKGLVLDIETNEKIAFVSIYQKNKNGEEKFGIMSNEKGEFILTVQNETIEVIFSHINYKTEKIKINDQYENISDAMIDFYVNKKMEAPN